MRNYKNNVIVQRSFDFALAIIEFSEVLQENKKFVLANQVLRSGCSIGANIKEAQSAESKADFIHKMKIASKEAEETEYWLELCDLSKSCPSPGSLLIEIESILKILSKIISSSKSNAD
jgi:four helix bundle protein